MENRRKSRLVNISSPHSPQVFPQHRCGKPPAKPGFCRGFTGLSTDVCVAVTAGNRFTEHRHQTAHGPKTPAHGRRTHPHFAAHPRRGKGHQTVGTAAAIPHFPGPLTGS